VEEYITDPDLGLRKHIKPVHKVLDLLAGADDNVASYINVKYDDRLETAQRPVIAALQAGSNSYPGAMVWSVYDVEEGARLRYSEFSLSTATTVRMGSEIPGIVVFQSSHLPSGDRGTWKRCKVHHNSRR
jgi:hypothetical protein